MTTSHTTHHATIRVPVQVTAKDIAKGKPRTDNACALALALKRIVRPRYEAMVGYADVWHYTPNGDELPNTTLPQRAVTFIEKFDAGKPVHPTTFTLALPACAVRPSVVAGVEDGRKKGRAA